ncbi:MAG TPA: EutN/CcmL family microcompartment protein [Chondromyces sp.]|nr:EutN/CcmL family microcompartment protein [Chondromyces sp.]
MYVGVVVGSVVATRKDDDLVGKKLLIVQKVNPSQRNSMNSMEVAVDSVGAGTGEYVLVTKGESARNVFGTSNSIIDSAIVAIVDSMEVCE